ncbi:oleate hydratase [Sphingomonas cavernae]|uniref:Oleate hydratase n=1 Tax=Sphingomonas cavernae TaxID=2320861 RepID=A0A418W6A6_9SPHN|nr:oleate hydratase [Sphingomonas cavernae]RJF85563.1 oleate hydratase [Sphingomonas cavernae]
MIDPQQSHAWLVGGGISSLAAAVFLIRDAGVPGPHVHILEESEITGGALDGALSPAQRGYVTRGGRMFEEEAYDSLWNLLETIPSLESPPLTVREEILAFNEQVKTESRARLISRGPHIVQAREYGFDLQDRVAMMRLMTTPEQLLGTRRIDEIFSEHFFCTNFWQMWRTTFAFQNWHSAVELRRYFLRFAREFSHLHTLSGVRRTRYNQYDSIVRPIQRWLEAQGVDVRFGTCVIDIDFTQDDTTRRRATRLHVETAHRAAVIDVQDQDTVFVTIGSIIADACYAGNDSVPELVRDRRDGSWRLWETLAMKAEDFGRPSVFFGNIEENKWESFTLTMRGDALLRRIVEFSNNQPGTGALMSFVNSAWLMSIVVPHQPHFRDMPPDTFTLWGYGLHIDKPGDFIKKPMSQCTGHEILAELVHHLGFEDALDEIRASTDVTTAMLPYASSLFSCRALGDRPLIVPQGAANFAFLGQFTEMPVDVVFTVEYSVHGAMHAVYTLYRPGDLPPVRHARLEPGVAWNALEALFLRRQRAV